jgi:hypothetical protein
MCIMKYVKIIVSILILLLVQYSLLKCKNDHVVNGRKYTDSQWRSDLDSLFCFLKKTHPNLYYKTAEAIFISQVKQIKREIPSCSDDEIITSISKLVSLVNDGHTVLMGNNLSEKYFPVRIESFSDGYFITAVSVKYSDLYGKRVIKIGNYSPAEAFKRLGSVTSGDNIYSRLYWSSRNLTMSSILIGLSIIGSPDILSLEVADSTDGRETIDVRSEKYPFSDDQFHKWFWYENAVPTENYVSLLTKTLPYQPLRLKNSDKPYWFEYIGKYKVLYFCFNSCENSSTEPFYDFIAKLWKEVDSKNPEKFVIDLRNNLGGTSDFLEPLVDGIMKRNELFSKGHLFILVGRKTFSAALHCATWIENKSNPVFVGEPTGAGPNHYADPNVYTLPNSKLLLMVSGRYWENAGPLDKRNWIEPQLEIDTDSKEYFSGGDPALQKIITYKNQSTSILKIIHQ